MRVIDIGSGDGKTCRRQFPDADIVRLDANADTKPDILHDITQPFPPELVGTFDAVYCSHVLEHIDRLRVFPTMRNLASLLADEGDLFIIVPALEWAMTELVKSKPSNAVISHIYGQQDTPWQYHRCGFTLPMLRRICMTVGLTPVVATQNMFQIHMEGSGTLEAAQDVVVARKKRNGNPADALRIALARNDYGLGGTSGSSVLDVICASGVEPAVGNEHCHTAADAPGATGSTRFFKRPKEKQDE